MQLSDYLTSSGRTSVSFIRGHHFDSDTMDLLHAAMGIVTETAGELLEVSPDVARGLRVGLLSNDVAVHAAEEIGDTLWYIALALRTLSLSFFDVALETAEEPASNFSDTAQRYVARTTYAAEIAANITDLLKKHVMYGKELNRESLRLDIKRLLAALCSMAGCIGYSIEKIAEMNDAKLRARYPEKFTQEGAINRNLQAEAEAMQ